jgi:NAD dependent epimerase/dehydratase
MDWTGKRVLVTGAGGFIGSHLTERLVSLGAEVSALVRYNSRNSRGWFDCSQLADKIEFFAGDIRDPSFVERVVNRTEVVFHLAALIGIPYSYEAPHSYFDVNASGTLNVAQAAVKCGATVIHTSTSEVYGTARQVPITEDHPLQAQSPYSASKIAADKLIESFVVSFGLPAVIVRPFNTFGPRQSARAVIPTIISQLLSGKRELQLGNLTPTRDLNYVSNTVDGFLAAAVSQKALGMTVHFGSGREKSIAGLAELIAQRMGVQVTIRSESERQRRAGSEVERLIADNSRAKETSGWEPRISLEEGIDRTIEWLTQNRDWYRAEEYVR